MATLVSCTVDPGGTGDYVSLNAAEAAVFGATGANLVDNDERVECSCICTNGNADTTPVTFSGITSDSDHNIAVSVPVAYRHEGYIPTSGNKYRMVVTSGSAHLIYLTGVNAVSFVGMAMLYTPQTANYAVMSIKNATEFAVTHSVLGITDAQVSGHNICYMNTMTGPLYLINNILYNSSGQGFHWASCSGTAYVYNNTVTACGLGIYSNVVGNPIDVILKNTLSVFNTDDYEGNFHEDSTHNAYSNNSDPGSNGKDCSRLTADLVFQDPSTKNYLLVDRCPVGRVGTNLYTDEDYAVTDDIIGQTRRDDVEDWCVGAHVSDDTQITFIAHPSHRISMWALDTLQMCGTYHP